MLKFTQWLIEQGVSQANIQVLLSPLETAQNLQAQTQILDLLGQGPLSATEEAIYSTLFNPRLQNGPGDQLLVYWSGHGFSDGEHLRLVCADATINNLRNHNFHQLLASFRTSLYKKLSKQIWIIDSCADFYDPKVSPPNQSYPRSSPIANEQIALFAASRGQKATIQINKVSQFTDELLTFLRASGVSLASADIDGTIEALKNRFEQLGAQGASSQVPSFLWRRDRFGSESTWGNLQPSDHSIFRSHQTDDIKAYIKNSRRVDSEAGLLNAAWEWLLPRGPSREIEESVLNRLHQQLAGQPSVQGFHENLRNTCIQIKSSHPPLECWIRRKLATLDYKLSPPQALPSDLLAVSAEINFGLMDILAHGSRIKNGVCHN